MSSATPTTTTSEKKAAEGDKNEKCSAPHHHVFHLSAALRLSVEEKGSKGGKRGTGGIAKQNAMLMRDGGYVFTEEQKEEEGVGGSMKEKNLAEVTTTAEEEDLQGTWKVYLPQPCPAEVITYHDASHPSSRKKCKNSSSPVAPSAVGEEGTSLPPSDQTNSKRETTPMEENNRGTEKEKQKDTTQQRSARMRFSVTEVCVVNSDSLTAGLAVGDAAVLSFGNADVPGGFYLGGARAQEEDLCRLLPQLYPSLELAAGGATGGGGDGAKSGSGGAYPIPPGTALLSRNMLAVRQPGSYALQPQPLGAVSIITAAMPICHSGMLGSSRSGEGGAAGSKWWTDTVTLRIRSVLHAACVSGHSNLVLGAFGCGMFGNPPEAVARIFKMELASSEFRGRFSKVVFAIIDPLGTGNLRPFQEELNEWRVADD